MRFHILIFGLALAGSAQSTPTCRETIDALLSTSQVSIKTPNAAQFADLAHSSGKFIDRARAMNDWIQSPDHAIYFYKHLSEIKAEPLALLGYINKHNSFFRNARMMEGKNPHLFTFSFEKETQHRIVNEWYTQDGSTTARKPGYLGELDHDGHMLEVKHRDFEIDPVRLMSEVREVAQATGETHSFHLHVAFEIPSSIFLNNELSANPRQISMRDWMKQLNDFIYLQGMEEGLHAGSNIRVMPAPEMTDRSLMNFLNGGKYVSAGFRRDLYGKALQPGYERIGIELRDTTRNLAQLEKTQRQLTDSLQARRWERIRPAPSSNQMEIRLKGEAAAPSRAQYRMAHASQIDNGSLDTIVAAEPTALIPLEDFGKAVYFDWKHQKYNRPEAAIVARIDRARANYLLEIKKVLVNLHDMEARGEKVDKPLLQSAIRMSLSDWAQEARVSELYSGY